MQSLSHNILTGHPVVDQVSSILITGNVAPQSWFRHIRYRNKRGVFTDPWAIHIFADIVYWYRPKEVRDEDSGALIGYAKRFKGQKLRRALSTFSKILGCSVKVAREALSLLEDLKLITVTTTSVRTAFGVIPKVLEIELHPDRLREITYPVSPDDPYAEFEDGDRDEKECAIVAQSLQSEIAETVDFPIVPNWAQCATAEFQPFSILNEPSAIQIQHENHYSLAGEAETLVGNNMPNWVDRSAQLGTPTIPIGKTTIYRELTEIKHTHTDPKCVLDASVPDDPTQPNREPSDRSLSSTTPVNSSLLEPQAIGEDQNSAAAAEPVENEESGWALLKTPAWSSTASFWQIEYAPWRLNPGDRKYRDSMLQAVYQSFRGVENFRLPNGDRNDVPISSHLRNLERSAKLFFGDSTSRDKLLDYADLAQKIEKEQEERSQLKAVPMAETPISEPAPQPEDQLANAIARLKAKLLSVKVASVPVKAKTYREVRQQAASLGINPDQLDIPSLDFESQPSVDLSSVPQEMGLSQPQSPIDGRFMSSSDPGVF